MADDFGLPALPDHAGLDRFLRARVHERYERARARQGNDTQCGAFELDPEETLRDLEAARRRVTAAVTVLDGAPRISGDDPQAAMQMWLARFLALTILVIEASPYADHQDYREEWETWTNPAWD